MRALLALASAWVVWRIVNENMRGTKRQPVTLLPKPSTEPSRRRSKARSAGGSD
jgi:hypothetical protein